MKQLLNLFIYTLLSFWTVVWLILPRIKFYCESLQVEGKWIRLSSGMSVISEIKTGYRRLIEYFLSPQLKYRQESIRER